MGSRPFDFSGSGNSFNTLADYLFGNVSCTDMELAITLVSTPSALSCPVSRLLCLPVSSGLLTNQPPTRIRTPLLSLVCLLACAEQREGGHGDDNPGPPAARRGDGDDNARHYAPGRRRQAAGGGHGDDDTCHQPPGQQSTGHEAEGSRSQRFLFMKLGAT